MKNDLIKKIKWRILLILHSIKRKLFDRKKNWIMGRVACMGQDVLKLIEVEASIINVQKGRIDYLNKVSKSSKPKTRISQVVSNIERSDIRSLVLQQQLLSGIKKKAPIALYMDSFSELTDQEFCHQKEKWSFYANYSDINHTPEFKKIFKSKGLLDVDSLFEEYYKFFSSFRKKHGSVPILFLHFPVKLDNREKFKTRYSKIKEAIDKAKIEFQPFYSFEVDENIVDWPEVRIPGIEGFPYHYNKATYENFSEQIQLSRIFKEYTINQ